MNRLVGAVFALLCAMTVSFSASAQVAEPHGWLNTETLKTRSGDFEFEDGYPAGDTAARLLELQKLNRAIEVYLTQMMPVSEIGLREGTRAFGGEKAHAGRDLGKPDGRADGAADCKHRDSLRSQPS